MTNNYSNLNATINRDGPINGVITSSKGSKNKYKLHTEGYFVLSRIMSVAFPFNYGFIPHTAGADHNALDVIVISSDSINQSVVVQLRIIGMLQMNDTGALDNKIVCVPEVETDLSYTSITSHAGLDTILKSQITNFFENYKGSGQVTGLEWRDVESAKDFVMNHKAI